MGLYTQYRQEYFDLANKARLQHWEYGSSNLHIHPHISDCKLNCPSAHFEHNSSGITMQVSEGEYSGDSDGRVVCIKDSRDQTKLCVQTTTDEERSQGELVTSK